MNNNLRERTLRMTGTHSRRASLLALVAGALAGTGLAPASEAAKKGKKAGRKRCKRQVAPCREGVIAQCAGAANPEACEAFFFGCCDFLARCNGREAARCFVQLI